jgi:hypothetical protein
MSGLEGQTEKGGETRIQGNCRFATLQEAYAYPVQHWHYVEATLGLMAGCSGHSISGQTDSKEDGGLLQRKGQVQTKHISVPAPAHEL